MDNDAEDRWRREKAATERAAGLREQIVDVLRVAVAASATEVAAALPDGAATSLSEVAFQLQRLGDEDRVVADGGVYRLT